MDKSGDGVELGEKLQKVGLNSDANNPDIRYAAYMRIDDIINENTVRKLAQSGLRFAQFGLETTYEPKMTSMNKGTTGAKIERFKKQQLPLLVKYEIMPHIFIIVGSPLEKRLWEDKNRFALEREALGRDVTPDDIEIFEAISNLRHLSDIREYIFTMKHTQNKLSLGSVDSIFPRLKGLVIKETNDLEPNVEFGYEKGYEISTRTINTLLALYELWKKEVLPYQQVTQEYLYHQRQLVGANAIMDIAREPKYAPGENRLTEDEKRRKRGLLERLYVQCPVPDTLDNRIR